MRAQILLLLPLTVAEAFIHPHSTLLRCASSIKSQANDADSEAPSLSRRAWVTSAVAATTSTLLQLQTAQASETKVLVVGGTGFVGSRVVQMLRDQGATVVFTSRDGRNGSVALDILTESNVADKVKQLSQGCSAVISCIGAIGTAQDERVNAASGLAAQGAKLAGVERFVMMGVSPQVSDWASDIDIFHGYVSGKRFARQAAVTSFAAPVVLEPTFIYGGDKFGVSPPRVASFYGRVIEGLLSSAPVRAVEGVMPPGFVKIALEPPVSVDVVASAVVAGALGRLSTDTILDTYDKIQAASKLL